MDDDPYEDEEEEEHESDELVVVEDKPYISHKQAQSVRLLGILENIERRVCFAPRAPHLTLPRPSPSPGAPSAPSRPKTSPFLPSRPGPSGHRTKSSSSKAMRAAAYYLKSPKSPKSRPATVATVATVGTGSDDTRPATVATVESKKNQMLGTQMASPVKPEWVGALAPLFLWQTDRIYDRYVSCSGKIPMTVRNETGYILLQHASTPHSHLCSLAINGYIYNHIFIYIYIYAYNDIYILYMVTIMNIMKSSTMFLSVYVN